MTILLAATATTAGSLIAACDEDWPSTGIEGVNSSMIVHIANCTDQGVLELQVIGDESRALWHIRAETPQRTWAIEYGTTPPGFEALEPVISLDEDENFVVLATIVTGQGRELTTRDTYRAVRLRLGDVYVTNGEYVDPMDYQNWAMRKVCPN
jgi:hypothetical protein